MAEEPAVIVGAFLISALIALWVFLVIVELSERNRPVVTKDPHTGDLYIPRSDLHVGEGRSHH